MALGTLSDTTPHQPSRASGLRLTSEVACEVFPLVYSGFAHRLQQQIYILTISQLPSAKVFGPIFHRLVNGWPFFSPPHQVSSRTYLGILNQGETGRLAGYRHITQHRYYLPGSSKSHTRLTMHQFHSRPSRPTSLAINGTYLFHPHVVFSLADIFLY